MGDSPHGGQFRGVFPASTPPAGQSQHPETLPSSYPNSTYSNYGPFSTSELPTYNHFPNLQRPHLPEPYNAHPPSYMHPGPRPVPYHPHVMSPFQHEFQVPGLAPATAATQFNALQIPGGAFPQCPGPRAFSGIDRSSSMQAGSSSFNPPSLQQWSSPPFPDFNRLPNLYPSSNPLVRDRFGGGLMRPDGEGSAPMRRVDSGTSNLSRRMIPPVRRASHDRQVQPEVQASGGSAGGPTRRPERSTSPRTSNRRSFERYSIDMAQSGNDTNANGGSEGPMHRARRPRTMGLSPGYRARMTAWQDPNIATPAQVQALRDKLRHLLPGELPEDASTMCDICQKDYSSVHVDPSEEAEVAIMLPCKHVFGEHCTNTWFDTCKRHKNKVTCPMCRKLLIEPAVPSRVPGEVLRSGNTNEMLRALASMDRRALERYLQFEDRHLLGVTDRDLEGFLDQ